MLPLHAEQSERVRSINLPGYRTVAWLRKAALKTHALQTLRDWQRSPNRAKRLECVRFIGAFRLAQGRQQFLVPMHRRKVPTFNFEP